MPFWSACDPAEVYAAVADLAAPRPAWMADAACREHSELVWVPGRGERCEPAKAICEHCLVRDQCLAFALDDPLLLGVWGGTSVRQRKAMRRA